MITSLDGKHNLASLSGSRQDGAGSLQARAPWRDSRPRANLHRSIPTSLMDDASAYNHFRPEIHDISPQRLYGTKAYVHIDNERTNKQKTITNKKQNKNKQRNDPPKNKKQKQNNNNNNNNKQTNKQEKRKKEMKKAVVIINKAKDTFV